MRQTVKMFNTTFISTAILFGASLAYADDTSLTAKVDWTDAYNAVVSLSDGREAKTLSQAIESVSGKTSIKLVESTCPIATADPECEIIMTPKVQLIALVWTKNPDASKVGQLVQQSYQQSTDSTGQSTYSTPSPVMRSYDFALEDLTYADGGAPAEDARTKMICKDSHFFDSLIDPVTQILTIKSASSEMNISNSETHANENRANAEAENLQFKKMPDGSFRLEKIDRIVTQFIGIFIGQNIYWAVNVPSVDKTCDINFSSGTGDLISLDNQANSVLPDFSKMTRVDKTSTIGRFYNLQNFNYLSSEKIE